MAESEELAAWGGISIGAGGSGGGAGTTATTGSVRGRAGFRRTRVGARSLGRVRRGEGMAAAMLGKRHRMAVSPAPASSKAAARERKKPSGTVPPCRKAAWRLFQAGRSRRLKA